PERCALLRQADLRYRRQAYELTVPLRDGPVTAATIGALAADFHRRHEQTYGHANRGETVQLVNLRLTAVGHLPDVVFAQPFDADAAHERRRDAWFPQAGFVPTPVHWREGLAPGVVLRGPVIVEAPDSTLVVPPGWDAHIDTHGTIRLVRG
ncbi:MAG TPA: hydantoinase/oxoprolinase family protein, partial [Acetobacteraceae bacterium]|nr:hydantoinase/oxoprolinase family protein [Acetobacteraceae bacterium]